jgi:hypothetical protein
MRVKFGTFWRNLVAAARSQPNIAKLPFAPEVYRNFSAQGRGAFDVGKFESGRLLSIAL